MLLKTRSQAIVSEAAHYYVIIESVRSLAVWWGMVSIERSEVRVGPDSSTLHVSSMLCYLFTWLNNFLIYTLCYAIWIYIGEYFISTAVANKFIYFIYFTCQCFWFSLCKWFIMPIYHVVCHVHWYLLIKFYTDDSNSCNIATYMPFWINFLQQVLLGLSSCYPFA